MTGDFHKDKDVDCPYILQSEGRKGLNSIQIAYECWLVSLNPKLTRNMERNQLLLFMCESEENES